MYCTALVRLPKLICIPKRLYESKDLNQIHLAFENVWISYYLRECGVSDFAVMLHLDSSTLALEWRIELKIFGHFACFKWMKIIQVSHVKIFTRIVIRTLLYIDSIYESLWTMRCPTCFHVNTSNMFLCFVEMVEDPEIPLVALGIEYYSGPVVTILASKTSCKCEGYICDQIPLFWR